MALDPVCGMVVNGQRTAAKLDNQGKTYHFCSPGCKEAFKKDPTRYLGVHEGMKHGDHH